MKKKKHMTRDEIIKALIDYGAGLAQMFNLKEIQVGEDREKGIWGEKLTEHLEKKYGQCTQEIKWFNGDSPRSSDIVVSFRFRFASPCLSISLAHRSIFAEIEYGVGHKMDMEGNLIEDERGYLISDDVYRPKEIHCWGDGSLERARKLLKGCEKRTHIKMENTYFGE